MQIQNNPTSFGMAAKNWGLSKPYSRTFNALEPLLNEATKGVQTAFFEQRNKLVASSVPSEYPSFLKSLKANLKLGLGLFSSKNKNGYVAIKKSSNPDMLEMAKQSANDCRKLYGISIK